ncbi:MAG: hypothetical protein ACRDPP_08415, partial [Gaiellaceae bacterium]
MRLPLKAPLGTADTGDVEHSSAELPHEQEPVEIDEPKLELVVPEPAAPAEPEADAEADDEPEAAELDVPA